MEQAFAELLYVTQALLGVPHKLLLERHHLTQAEGLQAPIGDRLFVL